MRSSVDEVRKGDKGGGKTDCRAIECGDEDVGVGIERVCDFEVVGNEVAKGLAAEISSFCYFTGGSDVGSPTSLVSIPVILWIARDYSRRKEAPFPSQDGDRNVITPCRFAHQAGEAVVEVLGEGIELLLDIQRDNCKLALGVPSDLLLRGRHSGA